MLADSIPSYRHCCHCVVSVSEGCNSRFTRILPGTPSVDICGFSSKRMIWSAPWSSGHRPTSFQGPCLHLSIVVCLSQSLPESLSRLLSFSGHCLSCLCCSFLFLRPSVTFSGFVIHGTYCVSLAFAHQPSASSSLAESIPLWWSFLCIHATLFFHYPCFIHKTKVESWWT